MVDVFQIATQGVGPGWSTFGFATQGFGFEVEVIVRPVDTGGGGWFPEQRYEIIVRIRYKDKKWEERREVSGLIGKSLEKIIATFKKVTILNDIKVFVQKTGINIKNIFVKIRK